MTNEQVIKRINEIREILADYRELTGYDHEALDIAISALSKQCARGEQADQCGNDTEMVDQFRDTTKKTDDVLINLPSAQPETNCSEFPNNSDLISRQAAIDDLKDKDPSQIWDTADIEVWINSLPSAQPEIKTDGDTISRQQTIDALMQEFKRIPTNSIRAKLVVENLPSTQPERKTGRWIRSSNKLVPYYCSSCTGRFNYEWNFCPNCGAKMLKDGDDIDS